MDSELVLVPFQIEAQVSFYLPILGDFLFLIEVIHEMLGMFLANVLHSEIIHVKHERYWTPLVLPKYGGKLTLKIYRLV